MPKKILVIGGAGYVGSALVPRLLREGHYVRVLDTFWFGKDVFGSSVFTDGLELIDGDIRHCDLEKAMTDIDCIIHLACISNDPSFELNRGLGKSVNYDAFLRVIEVAKAVKVNRFIFASTSSVYGIKSEKNVTEDLILEPLTDYSKYKAFCEMGLRMIPIDVLPWVIIRPATVCGYAPRLRLDLTVNILTMAALTKGKITVFGGSQKRPNINIEDMTSLYVRLVNEADEKIIGKTFNAGGDNFSVNAIAFLVKFVVEKHTKAKIIEIERKSTDDLRSYHISSQKIKHEIGWRPQFTVVDAIRSLISAFNQGKIPNSDDPKYYNIKTMQLLNIQ